ncbi:hypothetical protein SLOPH_869 [Spraguea lophii 42_110]|uniref:Protein kinase domain-containing protein n=1 Tax=Spraguea lophii (strain 42_110) TaxID=1358809 RepID=S7XW29_SPRLO|nr:hypothetical protein SLOPH_869 [Spraguea lophii 42_110]
MEKIVNFCVVSTSLIVGILFLLSGHLLVFTDKKIINSKKIINGYTDLQKSLPDNLAAASYVYKCKNNNSGKVIKLFTKYIYSYTHFGGTAYNVISKDTKICVTVKYFNTANKDAMEAYKNELYYYDLFTKEGFRFISPMINLTKMGYEIDNSKATKEYESIKGIVTLFQSGLPLSRALARNKQMTINSIYKLIHHIVETIIELHYTHEVYHYSLTIDDIMFQLRSIKIVNFPFMSKEKELSEDKYNKIKKYLNEDDDLPSEGKSIDYYCFIKILKKIFEYENIQKVITDYKTYTNDKYIQLLNIKLEVENFFENKKERKNNEEMVVFDNILKHLHMK